jgi:adenosine kinase
MEERGQAVLMVECSDAFAGGFMAGVVEGKSLEESVDMGHWLASLSIREQGPKYVLWILPYRRTSRPRIC